VSAAPRLLRPARRLAGTLAVPGDKSIGHRALLFASFAAGRSVVRGLPPGADVATTRRAVEALGLGVRDEGGAVVIEGRGWEGLARDPAAPARALDCGNSGTTSRLLLGLLAGRPGRFALSGDASLSRRPMGRVTRPLAAFGARIAGGETLPLTVAGTRLHAARVATGVASAQVKSALVLAALQADGESTVEEPEPTRDHTERMLAAMGAALAPAAGAAGGPAWRVGGGCPVLAPLELAVPGDPSSAAFFVGLACALPGSALAVRGVALNPRRTGALRILQRMGARLRWSVDCERPEPSGTIEAEGGRLAGTTIAGPEVVDAIDELPLLAVLASVAEGETRIEGAAELRVKESDRIAATATLLRAFGAACEERPDGLVVAGGARLRGTAFDARGDHRIAMAGAVAAALADGPSALTGGEWVTISYPAFFEDLERLAEPA
jgi:3-phosphoshikimate 1-carboxyvinyltransferase